jgi:hypothetical protein
MMTALRTGLAVRIEGAIYKLVKVTHHAGQGKMGGVTRARNRHSSRTQVVGCRLRHACEGGRPAGFRLRPFVGQVSGRPAGSAWYHHPAAASPGRILARP